MLFLAESLSSLWKHFFSVRIHFSVYIINSLLAAKSMCIWASYLFDCKPQLIKLFIWFHSAYNQGWLTFLFFCFIERYRHRRTRQGGGGICHSPRLEIFRGKCKLLKNPECKTYIQYSEKILGKLCFWVQGQVAQKSWTMKKCSVHSVYSTGSDLCSLGKLLFSGQIFSAPPAKCLPACLWV